MASLVVRRQSLGNRPPRIIIPPRNSKDENDITYDETQSPSLDTDTPEPLAVTPPIPAGLSPDLQPNTPPIIDSKNDKVLQIGKYLLVALIDNLVYKAVDIHTNEEKVCKVRKLHLYYRDCILNLCF